MKLLLSALAGGIVGGVVVWLGQTGSFHLKPDAMSYADLAATLLSAVSVILTALGLVIGLLAFVGFQYFKRAAVEAAKAEVRREVQDGVLKAHIGGVVRDYLDTAFRSGQLNQMLKDLLNKATYSGTEKKWLDVDKAGDEEI